MSPLLSKLAWAAVQPLALSSILLVLGLLLALLRRPRLAWTSSFLGTLIILVCAFTSFGYLLIQPLEGRFLRPAEPPPGVTGIIVLGGGMDADVNTVRKGYELNRSGDRFIEALRLARLYPDAKIVMTGGGSVLSPDDEREADAAQRFFIAFGIPPSRLVLENAALNTEENAQFTRELVRPKPGDTYLLITSAFHMPRSVGLFRRAGFTVVPWPVDYFGTGTDNIGLRLTQPAENLSVATLAVREWIGLVAYWLTGRIGEPLPGPA